MKRWYQYRIEEIYEIDVPDFVFIFSALSIARRMRRFMIGKMHFGGLNWQFSGRMVDWRGIYGSICEEEK